MNKKGVAITFNWIFSIIAGVIILSFLVYFAIQHTDLFGNLTAKQVAWEFDNVFSGFQTSLVETRLEFEKPIKLEFECDESGLKQNIWINGKGKKLLRDKLVFAPNETEGSEFLLYTDEWKVPYKVGMFVFLTSSREKYDLVGDIPTDLKLLESLDFDGGQEIRFERGLGDCADALPNEKVIKYNQDSNGEYFGNVCIEHTPYGFYGNAMLYTAIFSENFDCMYKLMMRKLSLVTNLYTKKIDLVDPDYYVKIALEGYSEMTANNMITPSDFRGNVENIEDYNKERLSEGETLLY